MAVMGLRVPSAISIMASALRHLLKPYPANFSISSQTRSLLEAAVPRSLLPAMNFSRCLAMSSRSFLPMARRSVSASPMVKPAISEAICMICSW
jgi:hypothetical protein